MSDQGQGWGPNSAAQKEVPPPTTPGVLVPCPPTSGTPKDHSPVPYGIRSGQGRRDFGKTSLNLGSTSSLRLPHVLLIRLTVSWPRVSVPGQPAQLSPRTRGRKHSSESLAPTSPAPSLCYHSALCPQPRGAILTRYPHCAGGTTLMSYSQISTVHLPGDKQVLLWGTLSDLSRHRGDLGAQSQRPGNRQVLALPGGGGSELPVPGGVQTQAAPRPHGGRWRQKLTHGER